MKFFSPRVTPAQNLAFCAFMAGFDALLCLLGALLPLSSILLMLVVPLLSSAVSLFCKNRYIPIYIFGAIGVSLALSAWNIMNTVFYLIPGLLVGVTYGLFWKLKTPATLNIFAVSLLSTLLFYSSIFLLGALFDGVDMINVLLAFIGRGNEPISRQIFPLFAFGYSLAQIVITHIFVVFELGKMGIEEVSEKDHKAHPLVLAIAFLNLSIVFAFLYVPAAYLLLGLGLYWAVVCFLDFYPRLHPLTIVLFIGLLGGTILLFGGCYKLMPPNTGILLLSAPFALGAILSYLNRLFLRLRDKKGPRKARYE